MLREFIFSFLCSEHKHFPVVRIFPKETKLKLYSITHPRALEELSSATPTSFTTHATTLLESLVKHATKQYIHIF